MRTARVELALLPWRGSAYAGLPSPHIVEGGVGFEPTDDLKPPAVFETAALSRALPTYRLIWRNKGTVTLIYPLISVLRKLVDREGFEPSSRRVRTGCSFIELTIH